MMTQIYHQLPSDFVQVFLRAALTTWQAVSLFPQIRRRFTLTTVLIQNRVRISPYNAAQSAKKLRNQLTTTPPTTPHSAAKCEPVCCTVHERSAYRMVF